MKPQTGYIPSCVDANFAEKVVFCFDPIDRAEPSQAIDSRALGRIVIPRTKTFRPAI
jgi:hypothetical protein